MTTTQSTSTKLSSYRLGTVDCPPGERRRGTVPVATGAAGQPYGIPLEVVHGAVNGPVLCVAAGIHGDEYDSQEAVRQVLQDIDPGNLRGTFVGIPCMNVAAFEAATRVSGVDFLNLNRIFPGDADGSLSQRLAATFVAQVIPAIDALVDLHTGGTFGEITPLAIVQQGHEELATGLGMAAGHEIIWKGGAWGGTARASTLAAGKPAITIEAGGGTFREQIVDLHTASVRNIMRHLGLLDGEAARRDSYTAVTATFARAAAGGFYRSDGVPGGRYRQGEQLGVIVDHYGTVRERVLAPSDGVLLWQRRLRTVQPGEEVTIFGPIHEVLEP